ncbi:MAG TPA: error-prone DNA polymerase [Planctomycetota bacterium]|nr:error-prone DNA polymerase [Planctomycetota bacterium]
MRYAELHCKTNFSFLEGASFADELVHRAAELELSALGITDRNSLAGVVRAHVAGKELNFPVRIGAEIVPIDGPPILMYPTHRAAYGRLSKLITVGRRRVEKGECEIRVADVLEHAAGCVGIALPEQQLAQRRKDAKETEELCVFASLREAFPSLYLAAELHLGPDDPLWLERLQALSREINVPLVPCNDVHYHDATRRHLQDVLTCIRHGCTLDQAGAHLFRNGERRLKSPLEMENTFRHLPPSDMEALFERTLEIVHACTFKLDELKYEYPEEIVPPGRTPMEFLKELAWQGAAQHWPGALPEKVRKQIEHELVLIEELHYEAYFLTVWDLVKFARSRNILCQGRGSAANSAVCFCLGITAVDPARSDVLFERFISRERAEAPDIDVDFEHERREEVMQYVYQKYGRERAGIVAEVITYRPKSAVRDIAKALGFTLDRVELLAATVDAYGPSEQLPGRIREAGMDPGEPLMQHLMRLTHELLGFPRHLSQHVGGFVITRGSLCELVPIENARMQDRTFIEWDKDDIDDLGILKVDCLALGMLTALHRCLDLVNCQRGPGPELTLRTIPPEDKKTYDMCCRADTIGVFQIESRAQMAMLPRLKPRCFYDLVIEVSIVRPGPIQGGMVHPYLKRRAGEEPVTFPNDAIREVLHKTLGVPLFQEQVMRLAIVAAGFTPGEADQLRRAMGAWRRPGIIDRLRDKLLNGMLAHGYTREFAERIYEQIRGFGEYGFPESHAASFALLVYASAWLKCYYPAAFCVALLNSQPMGFYAPAQLIRDAQNHGVTVLPVDVNFSEWDCTLPAPDTVRLGLRMVRGFPQQLASRVVEGRTRGRGDAETRGEQQQQLAQRREDAKETENLCGLASLREPYLSVPDLARRAGLSQAALARLAAADAFQSLKVDRRGALWDVLAFQEELPLFAGMDVEEAAPKLEPMAMPEHVRDDYETTGLSLKAHPIGLVRRELDEARVTPCAGLKELKDGQFVRVGGLVLVRQRPETASGVIFMTLEDETGTANLVLWPKVYEENRRVGGQAGSIVAEGSIQKRDDVIHVVVKRLRDLSELLPELRVKSRDFR